MSKKLYFSPSSQPENKYACGNTNEQEQCNKIALECVKIAKRCGFEAKTNTNSDMYGRTKESNDWGADLHMPIHTNAANGKVQGTRLFSFDAKGTGYKVCKSVMKTLAPITPGTSDSITVQSFYEITDTNAPCCYIEVAFHDNVTEAKWIIGHTKKIAEAIVKGICNYYGVKYVSESKPTKPTEKPPYKKVTEHIVNDVIAGKYGNGKTREKKLVEAGYNYDEVQTAVNKKLSAKPSSKPKFNKGDKAKVMRAVSYDGVKIDAWVLNRAFPVIEANGNRIVLGNGLNTAFNASDLKKV